MACMKIGRDDDDDGRESHVGGDGAGRRDAAGSRSLGAPTAANAEGTIEDAYRHRSIGSLHALGLAVAASILLTGLLWIAL